VDGDGLYSPPLSAHGKPRRTLVLLLSQMSLMLYDFGLSRLAEICLDQALDCEAAATEKATERGLPASSPGLIRHILKRAQSERAVVTGNPDDALVYARESVLLAESTENAVEGWIAVARAYAAGAADPDGTYGSSRAAELDAYANAMRVSVTVKSKGSKGGFQVPLSAYLKASKILMSSGRFLEAVNLLLEGCALYPSPSLFLSLGVSCLRLERVADAEDALQESNLLDCRRAEVWAFLCLLCLGSGAHRLTEAEKSCEQALRLGLTDAAILRELATGYMAMDQLQRAEDLVRRAMASEVRDRGAPNSYTRKLLADILATQNSAAAAAEEYQAVIGDETAATSTRLEAVRSCLGIVRSLGRFDEVAALEGIASSLTSERGSA